jgi:hypothetical protein
MEKGRLLKMKSLVLATLTLVAMGTWFSQPLQAQEHVEVGVFANYFRFSDPKNFWGLGARGAFTVGSHTQLEAEMAYDFEQSFGEIFTNPLTGVISFQRSPVRLVHGFFGPEFHTAGDKAAVGFFTLKGGFISFRFDDRPATLGTFFGSFDNFRDVTKGTLYPAAGLKAFLGPVGIRLEFGDEIYFMDGPKNNLRVTFGPTIRF